MVKKKLDINAIPKEVDLFGRKIITVDDTARLNIQRTYGEARYGINHIAISSQVNERHITDEELKLTYLHEMMHFILNFTGYEKIIMDEGKIDLEQFIELIASGIYQYEKNSKY